MKCPVCGEVETRVINSRPTATGDGVRRRRACPQCKARFTTMEMIDLPTRWVRKRGAKRERYDPEKLRRGLRKACEKRNVPPERIETLASEVEHEAFKGGTQREATTEELGRCILRRLKALDKVAYLRFVSVYKQFQDVQDFDSEIRQLLKD